MEVFAYGFAASAVLAVPVFLVALLRRAFRSGLDFRLDVD